MHPEAAEEVLKVCRQRSREGDCPTIPALATETLEDTVIEFAQQRDNAKRAALRTLGEGVMKFAPDLGKELAARWAKAATERSENLERFMAVLRQET